MTNRRFVATIFLDILLDANMPYFFRLCAGAFMMIAMTSTSLPASAANRNNPDFEIQTGQPVPKCPAKPTDDSPRICLKGNILYRLYIPAGNPWYYGPCFADGTTCVDLRYFGL
jgi:hypothetical protein